MTAVVAKVEDLLETLGVESELAVKIVAAIAILGLVWAGFVAIGKMARWGSALARSIAGSQEHRARVKRRRLFAETVDGWLRDIDNKEDWSDHRFAELEAEVETDREAGAAKARWLRPWRRDGLRRERSLSRSLDRRSDRVILLEGDPGSGKSVALRHVARRMVVRAMKSRHADSRIPLYVNLKGLHARGRPVDGQLIEEFVLEQLQDGANRDVHRFLAGEFGDGKGAGTWFFLFDSFDEIPAVLSATDLDDAVREYSAALLSFMGGMNACRGVIASRSFRAPPRRDLPHFRIVPLSERRRRKLVRRSGLGADEAKLASELPGATQDVVALSSNPLFLGLLCDHVQEIGALPNGWHEVFESYVSRRIESDAGQVQTRFGIGPAELRRLSEEIAFTMTATQDLGLSPARSDLTAAYVERGFDATEEEVGKALDALEWIKLGRSESGASSANPVFTFAHRRFQEYFATSIVLRDVDRVSASELLSSASWRETAVTLLQSRPEDAAALLREADGRLAEHDPGERDRGGRFVWPVGLLHLLGILQSGFAGRTDDLPVEMQVRVWRIVRDAYIRGGITDRKWVLEVAGTAQPAGLETLLQASFQGGSDWLREVAFRQAARMPEVTGDLAKNVREALVGVGNRRLLLDWLAVKAQLLRLRPSGPFVNAARMLRARPVIDALALSMALVLALSESPFAETQAGGWLLVIGTPIAFLMPPTFLKILSPNSVESLLRGFADIWPERIRWGRSRTASEPVAAPEPVREKSVTAVRYRTSDWRDLARFILVFVGFYARLYLAVWPLFAWPGSLLEGMAVTLALCATVGWGPAATLVSVQWPPRGPLGWSLPPVRASTAVLVALGSVPLMLYLYAILIMGAAAGIGGGAVLLLNLLSDTAAAVVAILFCIVALVTPVGRRAGSTRAYWAEARWYRRWSASQPAKLSGVELLEILSDLEMPSVAVRVISEVRRRRLLADESGAEALVGDAVWSMSPERWGDVDGPWRSATFAAWAQSANGSGPRALQGFSPAVQDELGRLLEDLQDSTELPSA